MGSVAEKVVRQAACPVLTVRRASTAVSLGPRAAPARVDTDRQLGSWRSRDSGRTVRRRSTGGPLTTCVTPEIISPMCLALSCVDVPGRTRPSARWGATTPCATPSGVAISGRAVCDHEIPGWHIDVSPRLRRRCKVRPAYHRDNVPAGARGYPVRVLERCDGCRDGHSRDGTRVSYFACGTYRVRHSPAFRTPAVARLWRS